MSIYVYVSYEPDGSPSVSIKDRKLQLKVSRLQSGKDICRQVYEQAKHELRDSFDDYTLFWPERKLWIHHGKQLGLIKIEAGAQLQFRPRKAYLKISMQSEECMSELGLEMRLYSFNGLHDWRFECSIDIASFPDPFYGDFQFLDASLKTLLVDETRPVRELVSDLCTQLGLEHPEELSLVVAGDYAVQKHHPAKKSLTRVSSGSPIHNRRSTLTRKSESKSTSAIKAGVAPKDSPPLSPSIRRRKVSGDGNKKKHSVTWTGTKVKKQISKKHQIRLDTPWLDPGKTLAEQEVTESDELILMFRFYYHMELESESPNIEMLYKQARATYLAGELLCSAVDMVRLSAILCQITKGNYSDYKYSPEFLSSIKTLIAPPKCKLKGIAKQITAAHRSLEGLSVTNAMCWFVKVWSSLDLFGVEFLSCTNLDTKDKGLIGVSKSRIMFLLHKKKKSFIWDFDSLMNWNHDAKKDTVALTLTYDSVTEVLNLYLQDYSGVLVDCLRGHRELSDAVPDISRMYNEFQFSEELELAIGEFAPQPAVKDVKDRKTLSDLTYEKVFWAGKIENPMLSEEELSQLQKESWENPVFDNMDQLMDERFNFLDYNEYTGDSDNEDDHDAQQSEEPPPINGLPLPSLDSSSRETSPLHSPSPSQLKNIPQIEIVVGHGKLGKGQSPLLESHRTGSESHLADPDNMSTMVGLNLNRAMSSSHSGHLSLSNGHLAKELVEQKRGHSRSKSSGSSSGDSDSGIGKGGSSRGGGAGGGGPLSSSSLPPDSLRRLVQSMQGMGHGRKGSGERFTASYHEAA